MILKSGDPLPKISKVLPAPSSLRTNNLPLKAARRIKSRLGSFAMVQQPVWYKGKVVTTVHDYRHSFKNRQK